MSRLVKGATGVDPALEPRRVVPAAVADAHQQAARVIAGAEELAERQRAQTERELEARRQEVLQAERERSHAEAAALLLAAQAERTRRIDEVEQELPGLIREIARRVLGRELALPGAAVVDVVLEALRPLRNRRQITVRLSPSDLPGLEAAHGALQQVACAARVELLADDAVEPGGCIVVTEVGRVDARLETQLERLVAALLGSTGPDGDG
jgi:flagellar biosynthesis/type III secretory pathway protein FliH